METLLSNNSDFKMKIELFRVPKILGAISVNHINISVDHYPNNIKLMDTELSQTGKINVLLEVEYFTNF